MADNPVAVGLRFRPTQQELIHLLKLKCLGVDISTVTSSVLEENLYGEDKEPWRVFCDNEKWDIYEDSRKKNSKKRVLYVINKLSKKSAKKSSRTAGHGTWEGQTKLKPVNNNEGGDQVIGWMKSLNYVLEPGRESEAVDKSYYYMHEYSLSGNSLRQSAIESTDYVISRIVKDDSKPCNVKSVKAVGKACDLVTVINDKEDNLQDATN